MSSTKIVKTAMSGGTFTKITRTWTSMSPLKKMCIGTYFGLVAGTFTLQTYFSGKTELTKNRLLSDDHLNKMSDIEAIRKGCHENVMSDFWTSLFFPWKIASLAMPNVILLLNPPAPVKEEPRKSAITCLLEDKSDAP